MKTVIYDIGANNGDDIPYYLMKADLVVAVEANPTLCTQMRQRFAAAIQANHLVIENCVAIDSAQAEEVDFYLHNSEHVLSQLIAPSPQDRADFSRCRLPARPISDLIAQYGSPHYIKIDIEGFDAPLLRAIFAGGVPPPYISAECQNIEVFQVLLEKGGYRAFKLVEGQTVSAVYSKRQISCLRSPQSVEYSFPYHSAGPFGNDVDGNWMTPENFMKLLAFSGLGWKDIHATRIDAADDLEQPKAIDYLDRLVTDREVFDYTSRRLAKRMRVRGSGLCSRIGRWLGAKRPSG